MFLVTVMLGTVKNVTLKINGCNYSILINNIIKSNESEGYDIEYGYFSNSSGKDGGRDLHDRNTNKYLIIFLKDYK